jgi:glycosyltransferase involved in cell wall biosynthesis
VRIGLIAPPLIRLPPPGYAGTERVVTTLAVSLQERGHDVTVFATGDSTLPCRIVPVVPEALWRKGHRGAPPAYLEIAVAKAWAMADQFDIIHSHIEAAGFLMARYCPTPVVSTMHRRLDVDGLGNLIDEFSEVPLVAISDSQRRWNANANWVATIHHGLDFSATPVSHRPGDYLLLVGRISPEKGVAEAIEVAARRRLRLVVAAKVHEPQERQLFEAIVQPAIAAGIVDWRGEVSTEERDRLMAGALATLMLGAWPEPFGLVAIESMATGTPVIARRAGGCVETIQHGTTGFLVDDIEEAVLAVGRVGSLRRDRIATDARERFSADRMVTQYERVYETVLRTARVDDPVSRAATEAIPGIETRAVRSVLTPAPLTVQA